jgi:5S rRNA maturation endonuclease (ribonuclease M5)
LFGLPPPFFKYSKKFDQLEIVCKFNEEIEALDSNDNGFIPVNILKNVLEGELKVKTKIVDDFVNSLRDIDIENQNVQSNTKMVKDVQSLDVNMITNSLKTSHVDYIVLLRKLSQFMDQNRGNTNVTSLTHTRIIDQIKEHESAQEVSIYFEIDNGMRIKNPISDYETPNTFVCMKPTFHHKEQG